MGFATNATNSIFCKLKTKIHTLIHHVHIIRIKLYECIQREIHIRKGILCINCFPIDNLNFSKNKIYKAVILKNLKKQMHKKLPKYVWRKYQKTLSNVNIVKKREKALFTNKKKMQIINSSILTSIAIISV